MEHVRRIVQLGTLVVLVLFARCVILDVKNAPIWVTIVPHVKMVIQFKAIMDIVCLHVLLLMNVQNVLI
jgi:hypothetical protein